jgi:hypothetical protein
MILSRTESIPALQIQLNRWAYHGHTVMCLNAAKLIAVKEETPVVPLAPYADVKEVGPQALESHRLTCRLRLGSAWC